MIILAFKYSFFHSLVIVYCNVMTYLDTNALSFPLLSLVEKEIYV
jgi:hypothetical protein